MRDFFASYSSSTKFYSFGKIHIALILFVIISGFLIYKYREKLKKFKYKEQVRYVMAIILFLNMLIYYIGEAATGMYNWREDLPFHFCFVTGYAFMFILLTGNKKLYKIIYFFTFVGPGPAILWPDLKYTFDTYVFYQFIISHHLMLITSLYLLFVLDYTVEKKYIGYACIVGHLYIAIMAIFNYFCKTNYVMMKELPSNIYNLYPFIKYMPPIFWLELVGIAAMFLAYIPANIMNKNNAKKEKKIELEIA
ncbi:MAG: TIGR02206 family membrane protein [Clostridia bacterium]